MEVYQDLIVTASADQMNSAVAETKQSLPAGWSRDFAAEERSRDRGRMLAALPTYCWACTKDVRREAAALILAQKKPGIFSVLNIVPVKYGKLSIAQYNAILEDFYQKVFLPVPALAGLPHELTSAQADLEHWMSPRTADLLRRFSGSANKANGSAHPNDEARWNAFLVAAHKENSPFTTAYLRRWLMETEHWPEEVANELVTEYENARELLKYAAEHNGI